MWNKELYVREQQDAYEFFTSLVDQLDEHLKVLHTQLRNPTEKPAKKTRKYSRFEQPNSQRVFPAENGAGANLQKHISGNLFRPEDL